MKKNLRNKRVRARNYENAAKIDDNKIANSQQRGVLTQKISFENWLNKFEGFTKILPNPDPVLKKLGWNKDVEHYRDILTDPQLFGVIENNRKPGVTSLLTWISNDKADKKEIEFFNWFLENLKSTGTYNNILNQSLDAPQFGRMVFGVVWSEQNGYFLPAQIDAMPHELCKFNSAGELLFSSDGGMNFEKPDHPARFIVLRHKPTIVNPYGEPLLSKCYWNIIFKKNGFKFWNVFMERYGMPWVVGQYDAQILANVFNVSPTDVGDIMLNDLNSMTQDGVFVAPNGIKLEILQTGNQQSIEIYNRMIRLCDEQNTKLQLGHSGASESTSGDKLSNDTTAQDVRASVIASDKQYPMILFNSLFYWIHQFNFNGAEIPQFSLYSEEDVDKTLAERDSTLVPVLQQAGLKFSKNYLEKNYGFDETDLEAVQSPAIAQSESKPAQAQTTQAKMNIYRALNENNFINENEEENPEDQQTLDSAVKYLEAQKKLNAELMKKTAETIFNFADGTATLEEMLEKYAELFPDMDTSELLDRVEKITFAAHAHGAHSAELEDESAQEK